jgi:hypothetical protein
MRRLHLRYAIGLLAALSLAFAFACGGGDTDATTATQPPAATPPAGAAGSGSGGAVPDSCALLSESQVATAMAEAVAKKTATSSTPALSVCQWEGVTTGRRFVYVTIRQAQFATSVFNNSFKSRADGQAVSGLGKEAIAIPGQNTPNDYRFLTGAVLTDTLFIQVDVAGPNRSDVEALNALTTVMRTVLAAIR